MYEKKMKDAAQYSDDFARYVMFPLAMGAYSSDPQKCITSGSQGKLKRFVEAKCDETKNDTCAGYTAVSDSMKAIILSFRGTDGDMQLALELLESFRKMIPFNGGGADYYFYNGFISVWYGGMKDDFLTLRQQNPDYEIWITGHSLGAAIAAIASDYLAIHYQPNMDKFKVITFGEPRVGNQSYAISHDQQFIHSFRVVHNRDLVTQLPLQDMGYHHHGIEVFYPNKMAVNDTYKICVQQEDKNCQDGQLDIWNPDHNAYFDTKFHDYIDAGCPRS
ncbi:unnamed protein product, partial [Mesorhabditis belari]|uniref:Fungal lipase-type domain-containing protein n=1 Tax=Mesorhabditis belari TaxID=2138241 RepID=A0AAF3EKS1_9BILA